MGVIVWYEANQDYVAAELCENKEKPQLHCNGKCFLKKQLNKVEHTPDGKQLPAKKVKSELPEYVASNTNLLHITGFNAEMTSFNIHHNDLYTYQAITSIFHPPSVC